jgi:hypothetical protein
MPPLIRLCPCLLLSLSAAAMADKPRFGDTLSVSVGGMKHRGEASISSTRDGAPVDELTFGELGFDDDTQVFWGDVTWQFAERWQFSTSFSSFDGSGYAAASEGGNFGELEWEIGASLTSSFDMELYIVEDMLLEIEIEIGPGGRGFEIAAEEASVLAPLPNLSLVGGIMLSDRLYLSGHAGYFELSYDKYDGQLFSLRGALEWRPWRHVGLGAAYQYVDIDLGVEESDSRDDYDLKFYGPVLFVSVGF